MVFFVGGLNELDKLPFRRTRDFRTDNCPARDVVHDLEPPAEREQRIERMKRIVQEKLKENVGT